VTSLVDKSAIDALRASIPDLKESMEIGREHGSPEYPNNWPDRFDAAGAEFRKVMTNFYDTCQELQMQVMRAIALGIGLEEKFFDRFVDAADNNLRLLHYPATPASAFKAAPPRPQQVRAGKHTDYGTVTLLFQDLRGGLEVRSPEGTWVGATPIEGTVVINAGDLLNRWSNSAINSTEHQVVEPPSEPVDGWYPARYSCA
jgi:isopenicillin N synthase-like dioxygenase